MKKNLLIVCVLALSVMLAACSKKDSSTTSTDTKKESTSPTPTTTTGTTTNASASYFKVSSVENASGKNVAPNFTWEENGKKMSMNDLKGNVVLVNLWATWCGPCKKEIPDLMKISNEMKNEKFKMIGVNVFQNPKSQSIDAYLKENPISYTILDADDSFVKAFSESTKSDIEAVPTTFVVDKKGNIVETIVGMRDEAGFKSVINKYLN